MTDIEHIKNNIEYILNNIELKDIPERNKLVALDIFLYKREDLHKEFTHEELINILKWLLHTAYWI